jgi:SepF-like predicted cell division protein (DUF552 family)
MVFEKIKRALSGSGNSDGQDYVEVDLNTREKEESKVFVKLFTLKQYEDVNEVLNALREGFTIAIIDIKLLRQRDSIEMKRAISKVKKTVDALEGTIAGFGENIVIVTPSFATVQKEVAKPKEKEKTKFDDY